MTPNNFRVKNGLTVSNGVNITAGDVVISTGQLVIGATTINATSMSVSAQTAYSNAVSYTDTKIGTANTAMAANAATAYSNAVSYTDTKIGTANTAMAANAATAYTNAIAIAANATNITSGTVAFARLPSLYLGTTTIQSTSAAQAVSGITTLAAGNTTITGFANVTTTLQVGTNTATFGTAAYVVSNGNVGIGTSSPGAKLDVRGNLAVGGADAGPNFIAFRGTTADGPGSYEHTFIGERIHTPTESSELFLFKGNDPSASGPDRVRIGASEFRVDTYATALNGPFETVANSANLTTHFIVTNGGNVGIGNTAPGSKLVVAGAAALGNTTVTGFANVTSTIQGGSSLAIAGALSGVTTAAMGNTTITGFANVTSTIQGGSSLTIAGALSGVTTAAMGNTTITGFANVTSTIQGGSSLAIAGALSGVTTAAMGNTTITGFANVTTTIQGGSSLTIAGALSGVTTAAMGNTTITGFVNASASVNSALLTVGTSFVANTTVTTITDTTGSSSSTQPLAVKNGSYVLGVVPRSGSGAYNNIVTLDDTTIVVTGTSIGNANLAIVPWSGASGGFRMATVANSTTFSIVGNTTITGFANVTSTLQVGGVSTFSGNVVLGSVGVSANGGFGTAGQVLHSNGTATYWAADDNSGGTVTSIATANGLSGGTITTSGTLGVTTGSTLTVNTTGIHVNSALSIASLALSGDLTVSGNLTVSGTRTYVNTTTLDVGDNIFTLNADLGAVAPSQDAGIEIMRGTSANVQFLWDETNDRWSTNGQSLAVSSLVAAGALSGVTTAALGNTTITGFANVTSTLQVGGVATFAANANFDSGVLFVDGTNNRVGIGTTSPGSTLSIVGNTSAIALNFGSTVPNNPLFLGTYGNYSGIGMDQSTAGLRLAGDYSGSNPMVDMGYYTGGSVSHANWVNRVRVSANGNVGINTTTPQRPLHAFYDSSVVGAYSAILQGAVGGYGAGVSFQSQLTGGALAEMARITGDGDSSWNTTASTQDASLRFYTALDGTVAEKMRINSAGQVGIGNTSPAHLLSVQGTAAMGNTTITGFANVTSTIQGGSSLTIAGAASGITTLAAGNTTITGFANVSTTLQVGGVATFAANANFSGTGQRILGDMSNATFASRVAFQTSTVNGSSQLHVIPNGVGTVAGFKAESDSTFANGQVMSLDIIAGTEARVASNIRGTATYVPMTFHNSGSEQMRLAANGNFGIGNTAPASKLVVGGTSGPVTTPTALELDNSYSSTAGFDKLKLYLLKTGSETYGFGLGANADVQYWAGSSSTGNHRFYTSQTERMTLIANGNFGIGTTTPGVYRLNVAGQSYFSDTMNYGSGGRISWTSGYSDGTTQTIESPTSGSVAILTNGTVGMFIRSNQNVGIGTNTPGYKLEVNGSFAATTKSFVIPHPTKPGMNLRYGSLEGPENGVYVRGRLRAGEKIIQLPDYWEGLVDEDTYTVNLTPVGKHQELYVEHIASDYIIVGGENIDCFYTVFAERNDVEKLVVEF